MEIKVSIIIPVYNAGETLSRSLESAIAQTIFPKEILCIDDGSTDCSLEILKTYAEKYKYISILTQENNGAGKARNKGLELAKGQYVCFLDADDHYLDRHALDQMVEACQKNQVKICGSFRQVFDPETGETGKMNLHREICKNKLDGTLMRFVDYQDDFHYQSYIFEREMLNNHHIVFPDYRRYQDPPFFLRAMLQAEIFWVMPVELYCFRKNTCQTLKRKMRTADCLKGIRDNFRLAQKYHLDILQKRLLCRMGHDYLEMVLKDENGETRKTLCEIGHLLPQKYERTIVFYYLLMVQKLRKRGYRILEYWKAKNIQEIVLYGLGDMAKLLFWELRDSGIKIRYGVDQQISSFYDIEIISDYQYIEKNDTIVVTPLNETGQSIVKNLMENHYSNIILLSDFIDVMVQNVSIELSET